MAKRDNEFIARMSGMIYAHNIAKEYGVDSLEKDIKKRGLLHAPMNISQKQMDEFWGQISANMHETMLCTVSIVLTQDYGFDKDKIHEFKNKWDKVVESILDLDYIGEHFVSFRDYAEYLKSEFNIDVNMDVLDTCQKSYDYSKDNNSYHMVRVEKIVEILKENGFDDASEFVERKIS